MFITYHHADQREVDAFIAHFDTYRDVFIARGLGTEMSPDIIHSYNPDYVMQRIRQLYLKDSTVTVVLMGRCTWARRYVDWEIQSSLRQGLTVTPNGLLGIKLRSFFQYYPERLNINLKQNDQQKECYARVINYPASADVLAAWIEDAYNARTARANTIVNPRDKLTNNRLCV